MSGGEGPLIDAEAGSGGKADGASTKARKHEYRSTSTKHSMLGQGPESHRHRRRHRNERVLHGKNCLAGVVGMAVRRPTREGEKERIQRDEGTANPPSGRCSSSHLAEQNDCRDENTTFCQGQPSRTRGLQNGPDRPQVQKTKRGRNRKPKRNRKDTKHENRGPLPSLPCSDPPPPSYPTRKKELAPDLRQGF